VFAILADAVVALHVAFVLFVLFGGIVVLRRRWVAWLHVPAAVWGAIVEYTGWICPLTPLEDYLRGRAGFDQYPGDFITHYVFPLLYPADLTRTVQIALGTAALVCNAVIYWRVSTRIHGPTAWPACRLNLVDLGPGRGRPSRRLFFGLKRREP